MKEKKEFLADKGEIATINLYERLTVPVEGTILHISGNASGLELTVKSSQVKKITCPLYIPLRVGNQIRAYVLKADLGKILVQKQNIYDDGWRTTLKERDHFKEKEPARKIEILDPEGNVDAEYFC
ncbi:MAG: hypothetical protein AABX30_03345 [Nanoarchaeota archaeon]